MKIPVVYGNEKYHFGEKLQKRELKLVLRTTETDCQTGMVSKKVVFKKVLSRF